MTKNIRCVAKTLTSDGVNYGVKFEENSPPPRILVMLIPASSSVAATFTISSIYTITVT